MPAASMDTTLTLIFQPQRGMLAQLAHQMRLQSAANPDGVGDDGEGENTIIVDDNCSMM